MLGIFTIVVFFFLIKWALKDTLPTQRTLPLLQKLWGKLFDGEKVSGSQFMSPFNQGKFLNTRNEGLILDGKGSKRLDLKRSFENVAIISPVGGGKSQRYILPNLCGLDDCSIVCTDPSGELYLASSGYLESKGFEVKVLNLANPHYSLNYNPLAKATTYSEIDKLSEVIMRSGHPVTRPEDEIWVSEPQSLLTILMTCLQNTGEPEWYNLHNLLYLLQSFGADGKPLTNFIRDNAPNDGGRILNQFIAFRNGHEKMLSSFLTMARNALKIINNPDIAMLTSRDEFDFHELRQKKTVVYLIAPETDAKHYSFILNMFYTQFFEAQKQTQYINQGLPIHVLYDEFGHSSIPEFATIANTIRKFRVSLSLVLQNYQQLKKQYGDDAPSIFSGGVRTKLVYAGLDLETSQMMQDMLGKVVTEKKGSGGKIRQENNLMNADQIRQMSEDQALCVSANKEPIILNTTPAYQDRRLKQIISMPPAQLPQPITGRKLRYVPL